MHPSVRAAWPAFIEQFEGKVPFMYLDTKKLATFGFGNMVDTGSGMSDYGLSRPWRDHAGGLVARDVVAEEYTRIHRREDLAPKGGWAYKQVATLHLGEADIVEALWVTTDRYWNRLAAALPSVESWPADAQLALLNMAWNLGPNFLGNKWPNFTKAATAANFTDCAAHCVRAVQAPRDDRNRALFNNAALVVANGGDITVLWDKKKSTPSTDADIELQGIMSQPRKTLLQGIQPFGAGFLLGQAWKVPHGAIRDPRGVQSSVFNRYDSTGRYLDTMVCVTAGHCSTFATSDQYVWLSWNKVNAAGQVTQRRIARLPYRTGDVFDTDTSIRWFDPFTNQSVTPALDLDHGTIGLRSIDSHNHETYVRHDLPTFKKGVNQPLSVVDVVKTATFQGWSCYGDSFWTLRGATNKRAVLTKHNWVNRTSTTREITSRLKSVAATSYEPEGIWIAREPSAVLHVGARYGSSTHRRFRSFRIDEL